MTRGKKKSQLQVITQSLLLEDSESKSRGWRARVVLGRLALKSAAGGLTVCCHVRVLQQRQAADCKLGILLWTMQQAGKRSRLLQELSISLFHVCLGEERQDYGGINIGHSCHLASDLQGSALAGAPPGGKAHLFLALWQCPSQRGESGAAWGNDSTGTESENESRLLPGALPHHH